MFLRVVRIRVSFITWGVMSKKIEGEVDKEIFFGVLSVSEMGEHCLYLCEG